MTQLLTMNEKDEKLASILKKMEKVMIAFSGGVDSTFVLKRAHQVLGDQVLAVVAASETFPSREFDAAVQIAKDMGVKLYTTEISELDNKNFVANNPDRCYHCKTGLYSHMQNLAKDLGYPFIIDGSNVDDLGDYRPGLKAKDEQGVRSVLQEAGFVKDEIRKLSKELNLPTWNKPSFACLSSRIPYGTLIEKHKIDQLDEAEYFLTKLGLYQVRVRHHDSIARIEVMPQEMNKLIDAREQIYDKFTALGFTYVTMDMQGYRTGSMNETLDKATKAKATATANQVKEAAN